MPAAKESKHRQAFEAFAERVVDRFDTVEEVVLFGSVARREHGVRSDVDILVLVEDLSDRQDIEELAYETASEYGVSVTPVVVESDADKNSFLKTVEEEGVHYVRG